MFGQIIKTFLGKEAVRVVVADGAMVAAIWAGAGTGGAPDASNYADGQIGVDSGGAAAGLSYHVFNSAWVATGGTVANLYGA